MSYEDLPRIKLPLGQEVFISDSTIRVKKNHKLLSGHVHRVFPKFR
ncbi:Uncharacterised protein [uncultured archaeon]|nr:Uncharacterised protein [uncultured archaeon]